MFASWAPFAFLFFALVPTTAVGWTFDFDGFRQGPFTRDGYRPLPFWRIGVWSDDSAPASWTVNKQYDAHVDVNLRFEGAEVVQFYMYDIGRVERDYYYNYADPSPCMDRGQASGIADRANMTDLGALVLDANPDTTSANTTWISSAGRIKTSGLYAFAFITCRYMYQDLSNPSASLVATIPLNGNSANYRRVLYSGPTTLKVYGTVKVYQPYGLMPGQGFGFVPFYACLFVIICIVAIFLLIVLGCSPADRVLAYHWWLVGALGITNLVCILFLAYIAQVNNYDRQNTALAVATYLLQRMRDCWARIISVLLARGLGFLRPSREITVKEGLAAGFYGFAFFLCGIAEVVASGSDQLGASAVTSLSPPGTYILMVLVELVLAVVMLVAFTLGTRRTLKQLESKSPRRTLFVLSTSVVVFYAITNALVAVSSVANNQLKGKASEAGWKYWFFEACCMDGFFILAMVFLVAIWYPRETLKNMGSATYLDQANYDGFQAEANQTPGRGGVRRQGLHPDDGIAMNAATSPTMAPVPRPARSAALTPAGAQLGASYMQPAPPVSYALGGAAVSAPTETVGDNNSFPDAAAGGFDDLDRP